MTISDETSRETTRVRLDDGDLDEGAIWDDLRDETRAYVRGRDLIELRALRSLIRLIDEELSRAATEGDDGRAGEHG